MLMIDIMSSMKTPHILSFILLLSFSIGLNAADPNIPMKKASVELDLIKSFAGTWEGTVDHGNGPEPVTIHYKITSGGSAVEETIFPGTPMEMITLYYDKGDKLGLTHYCMMQNRPEMKLSSSSENKIHLEFDPACGIDPKSEAHMNSLTIIVHGKNSMTHEWTFFENGEAQEISPFKLKRADT
jgi:hypothetical protein